MIEAAKKVVIIQAENPDGDSLGSALALEEILGDLGKGTALYCDVEMPKYLRYINGWDRVTQDFDTSVDLAIIVDTSSDTLISKALELPGVRHFLESHPVLVIDHHNLTASTLSFNHTLINEPAVATGEALFYLAKHAGWDINPAAAEAMLAGILSDSLGLSTQSTTAESFEAAAGLVKLGAKPHELEGRRREFMKKSADILAYKGRLIERIEYLLDGKLTGKLRANVPIAEQVAGFFGGGGHAYAAGFRVHEQYDKIVQELVTATDKALVDYESSIS